MQFLAAAKKEASNQAMNAELLRSQTVTRYIFCPYLDAVVPSLGAFGGRIPKGRIVPIYRPWKQVNLRKENIDTETLDRARYQRIYDKATGKAHPYHAKEYFSPAEVVDWLAREYAGTGSGEIQSLAGMDVEDFEKLKLNQLLFNVSDEDMAEDQYPTAASYYERFAQLDAPLQEQAAKFPEQSKILKNVLREVRQAVQTAEGKSRDIAEEANNRLAAEDIKRFDTGQKYAFQFSGVTKRDEALNTLATIQNEATRKSFEPQSAPFDMSEFMAGMQELVKTVAVEAVKAAVAETAKPKAVPAPPLEEVRKNK